MVLSRALALVWRGNSTEGGGTNKASGAEMNAKGLEEQHLC
jgi:hypothetical protein